MKELEKNELQEIDGGLFWLIPFLAGAIGGGMIYHYIDDTEGCNNAVAEGFSSGSRIFQ